MSDKGHTSDNTSTEDNRRIERFLNTFSEIERALKRKLKLRDNDKTPVSSLIKSYASMNPFWTNGAAQLDRFASIRNFLIHERSISDGYPVAVTIRSLQQLGEILSYLTHPEPVSNRYAHDVITVGLKDVLSVVLRLAYENEFSQFPVMDDGRLRGLITENGITRWLGWHTKKRGGNLDLQLVTVQSVLEEEEKEEGRRGQVFSFVGADSPVDEVIGKFATQPMLEAVLLTENGGGSEPLVGIVTEWDASRYVGHPTPKKRKTG